ncbi:hypothetical protein AWB68_05004 [Caballeronia choica]|uniref:Uncharacterized protein n=1 Tax=Caballeronia choica TaxID=326476 RepID=A0A158K6A4_9BURK|nr:hypothetical protein [Caballeronia choica]SAL76525.1 hypothetical protein AWB68_05004 [Caballeronia choica]
MAADDDTARPDVTPALTFTKAMRRATCVHEAAHAVFYALGGVSVYRMAVAPEGCTDWSIESWKGDLCGWCEASEFFGLDYLSWCPDEYGGAYRPSLNAWRSLQSQIPLSGRHESNRITRAHICALLAGPIAGGILDNAVDGDEFEAVDYDDFEAVDYIGGYVLAGGLRRGNDIAIAEGLATLLYSRNEYDHLATLTLATLRRPDVWAMVLRLAGKLERLGDIVEFPGLLPEAVPHWPPSPRAKRRNFALVAV